MPKNTDLSRESQRFSPIVTCNMLMRSRLQIKSREHYKLVKLQGGFGCSTLDDPSWCNNLIKLIEWFMRQLLLQEDIHMLSIIFSSQNIAARRKLEDGDIINVDVTAYYKGVHGDLTQAYFVGNVDEASRQLVQCSHECLNTIIYIGTKNWSQKF